MNWITSEELDEVTKVARSIFQGFIRGPDMYGEEIWEEIQVGDRFFDINCWDEQGGDRSGSCICSLYPTKITKNGQWRETDTSDSITLFEEAV